MTLDEYKKIDSTFNQAIFISNCNRMIQDIYDCISSDQLDLAKNYMNDFVFQKISKIVENNKKEGLVLKYDDIFIDSEIRGFEILDGNIVIKVTASCNYSKFYLSNGNIVSGKDNELINVTHTFYFTKNNSFLSVYRCAGCGRSYDFILESKCPNCGNTNVDLRFNYYIVGMV